MKKKLLYGKCKKNLIKTNAGRVNFFTPWFQGVPSLDASRNYLAQVYNLPNLSDLAISKFTIVQKYAIIITRFSMFVRGRPALVQEFETPGTSLNQMFTQMQEFQQEHTALNNILSTPGATHSLQVIRIVTFEQIVDTLGSRGKFLKTQIFKWCKTNRFEAAHHGLIQGENLDPSEQGSLDSLETIEHEFSSSSGSIISSERPASLSSESIEYSEREPSLSSESIEYSEREPSPRSESLEDIERQLSPRSESLEDIEIEATNNWQVEARVFKPKIVSLRCLGPKRCLAFQTKLYFNNHSVGFKIDAVDSKSIDPRISLTYKKCMVGFQNHKNQTHLVIGKQISFKSIPTNFSINSLIPLTLDKEKFLSTSKINIDVTKNLIDKMPLNSHLPEVLSHNIGFQCKVIANLLSLSKNNKEPNAFSTKPVKTNIKTLKSSEGKGNIEGLNFHKSLVVNPRFTGPSEKNLSLSQNENSLHNQNFDELALVFPKFREARHSNRADLKLNECIHVSLDPCPIKFNGSNSVARLSGGALLGLFVFYIGGLIKRSIFDKSCEDIFYE
jgi:hypothetical protein